MKPKKSKKLVSKTFIIKTERKPIEYYKYDFLSGKIKTQTDLVKISGFTKQYVSRKVKLWQDNAKILKPKIEFNETKKKIEDKPIEWSDEIEIETTPPKEAKYNEYDLMAVAKKIQQKAEEDGMNVKTERCKKCGSKIFVLSEEKHTCYQRKRK